MNMERRVLQEFIDIYRMEQSLWKVKSCHYNNKAIKNMAYRRLLMKLKELYPEADIDMVKKKINALRTNFRKELRKVDASRERSKQTGEPIYVPSLWYFDLFHFIADQESELKNNSDTEVSIDVHDMLKVEMEENMYYEDESDENFDEEFQVSSPESQKQMDPSPHVQQSLSMDNHRALVQNHSGFKRKRDMSYNHENEWYPKVDSIGPYMSQSQPQSHPSSSDEHDIFGQYVASKLRKMDKSMQLLAERLISEVMYRGQTGSLSRNTTIQDVEHKVIKIEDSGLNVSDRS